MVTLFAVSSKSFAETKVEEKVYLDPVYSMNFIIDYKHCKSSMVLKKKEIIVLNDIVKQEKSKNKSLFHLNKICAENYNIKKQQAEEWKAEYMDVSDQLTDALKESIFDKWYIWLGTGALIGLGVPIIL